MLLFCDPPSHLIWFDLRALTNRYNDRDRPCFYDNERVEMSGETGVLETPVNHGYEASYEASMELIPTRSDPWE